MDSIDYLGWELGIKLDLAFTDGSELNFDISFLNFNVISVFIFTLQVLEDENKILQKADLVFCTPSTFTRENYMKDPK